VVVLGTRPEAIKLAPVILALRDSPPVQRDTTTTIAGRRPMILGGLKTWLEPGEPFTTP
jgi:UDP-N-acetylglucosamine 2-epimerase